MNLYNDNDPNCCAWISELIKDGLIPPGDVLCKSITEIQPSEVNGYTQCHFFAGIAGWPYALELAGVEPDEQLWTGSCPCQPYSSAGSQAGDADPRNLWPAFFRLIAKCRPERIVGEQVENAIGHGWLDGISADLEKEGYACGAVVLGAHSVGAPHRRQRLYWVAKPHDAEWWAVGVNGGNGCDRAHQGRTEAHGVTGACGEVCGVANADHSGFGGKWGAGLSADSDTPPRNNPDGRSEDEWLDHAPSPRCDRAQSDTEGTSRDETRLRVPGESGSNGVALGDADFARPQGRFLHRDRAHERSPWSSGVALPCTDGKQRRIEPGAFPLAHGVSGRVGLLRGYGNAIVPQVAAAFIEAALPEICNRAMRVRMIEPCEFAD